MEFTTPHSSVSTSTHFTDSKGDDSTGDESEAMSTTRNSSAPLSPSTTSSSSPPRPTTTTVSFGLNNVPSDVLAQILCFTNEETLHRCVFLSRDLRTELRPRGPIWRGMCVMTFRPPVYRKACVSLANTRFVHWADMTTRRARVRTDGVYAQLHQNFRRMKDPSMFDTWKKGALIEVTYYRYLAFNRNGKCRYLTDVAGPTSVRAQREMVRRAVGGEADRAVRAKGQFSSLVGDYTIRPPGGGGGGGRGGAGGGGGGGSITI